MKEELKDTKNKILSITNKRFVVLFVLAIFIAIHSYCIYNCYAKDVIGPVIGRDEYVYFALANSIATKFSYLGHAQYNPLYPFVTAFFVLVGNNKIDAFQLIKIFNCVLVSTAVIPFYLISKRKIKNTAIQLIVSIVLAMYPWKVVANLIVAEPLFFVLIAWYMYLFMLFLEKRNAWTRASLGICGGLLFLAKQAGIVAMIATAIAFAYEYIIIQKQKNPKALKEYGVILGLSVAVMIPWLIRNMIVTGSIMGYQSEVDNVANNFDILTLLHSYFSQISYLALSGHIIFLALFVMALVSIQKENNQNKLFLVLVAFSALGFMGLGALHHLQVPDAPYGRYISMATPFIVICGIGYLQKRLQEKRDKLIVSAICLFLGGISYVFNGIPISMLVKGNYNQYDLASLRWLFFDTSSTLWSVDYTNQEFVQQTRVYIIVITAMAIAVLLVSCRIKKVLPVYLGCVFLFVAYCGNYVFQAEAVMMETFNNHNAVFHYMVRNNIDMDSIYQLKNTNIMTDLDMAWMDDMGRKRGTQGIDELSSAQLYVDTPLKLDFGPDNDDVAEGYTAVKAPWKPEYLFTESSLFGFDAEMTYSDQQFYIGSFTTDTGNTKNSDVIYGIEENVFYINNGGGLYDISLSTNASGVGAVPLNCSVYINDEYVGDLNNNSTEIVLPNHQLGTGLVSIRFVPKENCIWSIGALELTPCQSNGHYDTYVLMNSGEITPLQTVYENDEFKLCYKQ